MLKKDLVEKIKTAKDDEDINSLLTGTDIEETFKTSGLTLDAFKEKIKTDKNFKDYVENENNNYHKKALDTWKKTDLEKELEPFIQSKYPELVTDPMQKKLLEQDKKIEQMEKDSARKDLLTEAIKYANEKKLPVKHVARFLGDDLDSTKSNLDGLAEDWSKDLESATNERMKSKSYVPGGGGGKNGEKVSIGALIAQQNNKSGTASSDPWASK